MKEFFSINVRFNFQFNGYSYCMVSLVSLCVNSFLMSNFISKVVIVVNNLVRVRVD